ncbi:DUF3782 domain-containing protein [Rhodoferax sp. 4810]|uniref:DUF3782 domain-containing protein n=1 Tax=Thiospirillum jenense TaxID=1653858 RepID=A0A839HC84_9GAMM|nr:DUF3782 domain-containing protein [Thiospirillum jenense]MBB1073089.1 DUF3782 domain-containing protein [Rhodoferax jenense]MBB1125036.1 DUF3782 domain-containing protein [Thiospirillum jenense]
MSVTYEEILNLFREVAEAQREVAEAQKETERQMKESSRETERQIKESFRETERQMKEMSQETDRQMKEMSQETDRRFRETERFIKQLSKNLGDIGNRLGEFVEHMVAPAVVRLFRDQGIDVHAVYPGVTAKRNGVALEIDLLVINDGALIGVECKSKLVEEHIDAHLERMAKLKQVQPIYQNHRVMGAVAGMVVEEKVAKYAMARGLYVLCQNGEQIDIYSPTNFTPKEW